MTPKTHQELVERCTIAAIESDSGPEGSELFKIHMDEFGNGYREMVTTILSEAYAALAEPNGAMHIAGELVPIVVVGNVWRAMLAASPLAKEGE